MIGIGIVGYGYWGPNIARCVADNGQCELVAIADSSTTAMQKAARRYPAARVSEDWRSLVTDPAIAAIIIATPVDTHYEIALAALQAGKHVLVEKPMTSSSAEASRLIEEAGRRELVLMVDHTFVYTGAVQKIKELIDKGQIGDLYYYESIRLNLGLFRNDVNVIWDLAVHDLAILNFLMGENPIAVSAVGAGHIAGSLENMAHITLFYAGGMVAHLNVNWLAPVKVRQTLIGGSRQMIVYDDLEPSEKVKVYDRGVTLTEKPEDVYALLVGYRMGDMWAPNLGIKEALATEIEHFAACIEGGLTPTTSGLSGLSVVETLECASRSISRRGHPVELRPLRIAS